MTTSSAKREILEAAIKTVRRRMMPVVTACCKSELRASITRTKSIGETGSP